MGIRRYFGVELKEIRNKYDYLPFISPKEVDADFERFKAAGIHNFELIIIEANGHVLNNCKGCDEVIENCKYCRIEGSEVCMKLASIEKIKCINLIINKLK